MPLTCSLGRHVQVEEGEPTERGDRRGPGVRPDLLCGPQDKQSTGRTQLPHFNQMMQLQKYQIYHNENNIASPPPKKNIPSLSLLCLSVPTLRAVRLLYRTLFQSLDAELYEALQSGQIKV